MRNISTRGYRRHARRWRGRSGSEVMEMALALPLLLLLAFGTIEFGYWFYLEHNFQAAATEAARAAIPAGLSDTDRNANAIAAVSNIMTRLHLPAGKYQVVTGTADAYDNEGNKFTNYTVTLSANWADVGVETGLFIGAAGGTQQTDFVHQGAKIVSTATMRIEELQPVSPTTP